SWGVVLRRRTPWKELTTRQRQAIIIRGVCQTALLAAALNDLGRRPRGEIRGPKAVWVAISAVNYLGIGPIAYLLLGRRHGASAPAKE
ncbi:MAG TPA: hypothetical protein VFI46_15955, partial [Jiangellaceae bacterium]|nr:hypothetical protein [Jiangellaceae bacterium]